MFPERSQPFIYHLRGTGAAAPNSPYYKRPVPTLRVPEPQSRQRPAEVSRPRPSQTSQPQNTHVGSASSQPGSAAWTTDLITAALKTNSSAALVNLALDALDNLAYGDPLWREVDALLGSHGAGGVPAATTALANRKAGIPTSTDAGTTDPVWRGSDFPIIIRPFRGKFGNKTISGNTTYILPPSEWPEGLHDSEPPKLDHAPVYCLFCMPKAASTPEDPWTLWILDADRHWQTIELRAPHPDPSLTPYVLKLRADKTPSWVQPATLGKDEKRAEKKRSNGPLSAVAVDNDRVHVTPGGLRYTRLSRSNAVAGPSRA